MEKLKKVLLIDDDEIVNSINKVIIQHAKFADEIIIENIAANAIDYIKGLDREDLPTAIFLDVNMPEMNGWDFVEEYDKIGVDKDDTKIIMLTSSINPRDQQRALSMNHIQAFVSKPLSPELLNQIYDEHFSASESA
ncbi:MAG: response regulator [Ekhidna sp.]